MPTQSLGRGLVTAAMAAVLLTQGCSLIGLGIGAASPKYERVEPPYDSLPEGSDVRVIQRSRVPADTERKEPPVEGQYRGGPSGFVFVETEWGGRALREREIAEVQRRSGSYWMEGLAVGFAVDVVIGSLLAAELSQGPSFNISVGPWH